MYDYWLVSHTPEPCEKELTNENKEGKCNVSLNYSILQYCNSIFRGRPLFRVVHLLLLLSLAFMSKQILTSRDPESESVNVLFLLASKIYLRSLNLVKPIASSKIFSEASVSGILKAFKLL